MTTITLSGGAALTTEQKTALRVEIGAQSATDVTTAASNAIAAHASAADPHPQYMTQSEGDQRYAPAGITGTTNLTATASPTGITVNSDTGTDAPLPLADSTNAGLIAPEQVTKLGGVADGATANATDAQLRDRTTHTGEQPIASVTGLQAALDGKAATGHGHAVADVTGLQAALDGKADLVGGKLPASQLPDIAVVDYLGAVGSQAAMLALAGQKGDWCTRTDLGTTWVITGTPSVLAGWVQLSYPAAPVTSVAGRTGAVTLSAADIAGLGTAATTASTAYATAAQGTKADSALQDLTGMQTAFSSGTSAQQAAFQSSVSGAGLFGLPVALTANAAANTAAILLAAAAGHPVILPHGSYPIDPVARVGDLILLAQGKAGGTTLTSTADVAGWLIQCTGRLEIKDIELVGAGGDIPKEGAGTLGLQSGVLLRSDLESQAVSLSVHGFGKIGIGLAGDTSAAKNGATITRCQIYNNWVGIDTGEAVPADGTSTPYGEYCKIFGNTINWCRTAYVCQSGNNLFTGNSLSHNGTGVFIDGSAGNAAHGNITGNIINHSLTWAVDAANVQYGHLIQSNSFYGGAGFRLVDCEGVKICHNMVWVISGLTISTTAAIRHSEIADNWFFGTPTIVNSGGKTEYRNNWDAGVGAYIGGRGYITGSNHTYEQSAVGPTGNNWVSNGDFASATGWTAGGGWTISGGNASHDSSAGKTYLTRAMGCPAGTYIVTMDITRTSGSLDVGIGGSNVSVTNSTVSGTQVSFTVTANGANGTLYIGSNTFVGSVDNISVYTQGTVATFFSDILRAATSVSSPLYYMRDVTAAPATPVAGGALYSQSGALKYIGSSGTVTTLAPA